MLIDLSNTTFIIPIRIESDDRYRNSKIILTYLNKHFNTNVIIYEVIENESKLDFLDYLTNLKIKLLVNRYSGIFHRTKYLNIMLDMVETPVVINYDIDVLLNIEEYVNAQNIISNNIADVVYPFGDNNNQIKLQGVRIHENFIENPVINNLYFKHKYIGYSNAGFCIFFNTNVYKEGGGENENFISYGPEDKERLYRFQTLGYRILRFNSNIYHIEHQRTNDSNSLNYHFNHNNNIYNDIIKMNKIELINYLNNEPYLNSYNFKIIK